MALHKQAHWYSPIRIGVAISETGKENIKKFNIIRIKPYETSTQLFKGDDCMKFSNDEQILKLIETTVSISFEKYHDEAPYSKNRL